MNEQLTTKQNKTIEALLLTNTIDRAAKRANVSESSIYRWMKQESFQTALRAARRDILAHTTTRLQQMSVRALDTLETVMGRFGAKFRVCIIRNARVRQIR